MGKNQHTRKLIAGQLRNINRHQQKIEAELQKPTPNIEYISQWEAEIDRSRKKVRKLEERLER